MNDATPMEERIAAILERAALDIRAVVGSSHHGLALLRDSVPVIEHAVSNATAAAMPKVLTPNDLAAHLQIDQRTLRRMRSAGEAPPEIRVAGLPRWRCVDVEQWLEERAVL